MGKVKVAKLIAYVLVMGLVVAAIVGFFTWGIFGYFLNEYDTDKWTTNEALFYGLIVTVLSVPTTWSLGVEYAKKHER